MELRSGADLLPQETKITWLGGNSDSQISLGSIENTLSLVQSARNYAVKVGVILDGWSKPPMVLTPKENLENAIRATWPDFTD